MTPTTFWMLPSQWLSLTSSHRLGCLLFVSHETMHHLQPRRARQKLLYRLALIVTETHTSQQSSCYPVGRLRFSRRQGHELCPFRALQGRVRASTLFTAASKRGRFQTPAPGHQDNPMQPTHPPRDQMASKEDRARRPVPGPTAGL